MTPSSAPSAAGATAAATAIPPESGLAIAPDGTRTIAGFATVFDAFFFAAAHHGDRPFMLVLPEMAQAYGIEPGELSYREAAARVERLIDAYRRAGYGHGHRAGLLLENRPAFMLHWLALNALGVSVVPINADMRAAELDYLVEHSDLCLAVVLDGRRADLEAAAGRVGRTVGVVGPGDSGAGSDAEWARALPRPPSPPPHAGRVSLDTECGLLYTSGTTGRPKGCVLPNEYYLLSGHRYVTLGGRAAVQPGDRLITPLPLVHMNAMAVSTVAMILAGGCVIQVDRFHPKTWWRSVRDSKATIVHYLGVMPAMLMGDAPSPSDTDHCVRFGFGAGVDKLLHAPFEQRFGFPLVEAWAMTETGNGAVIIDHQEPRRIGTSCFGRPAAWVEARLVDDEGRDVPAGTPGELLVRSAGPEPRFGFFREYLKDANATAQAWADGWFHTGDMVRADDDGFFYFVDRKKNVIRRSGENIAAVEVESVLRRHSAVKEIAVAAAPDAVRGDEVLVCIVPKDPADAADPARRQAVAESLVALSLDQLAYYKAPGYVAFVERLPLTATQKIQRGELKSLAATLPGTERCVDTRALKKRQ